MNRILEKSIKITTGLAFGMMLIACNNNCTKPKQETQSGTISTSKISSTESIVFVNTDSLLNNYNYFKKIKSQFQEKSKKAQADLSAKGAAFQNEVTAYQKNAANLSAEQRAKTEDRLARKQQELSIYNQNTSNALAKEESEENEKLYNKVAEYLKKHAKDKGYKMVLTYSKSNPGLLFADENLDVTKEVIVGLNEDYKGK